MLEGSVFVGGAVIQWLRDELRLFDEAPDADYFASKVDDTAGVYIVPAFTGLGAPYWDMYARGVIVGLTRGANRDVYKRQNYGRPKRLASRFGALSGASVLSGSFGYLFAPP